MRSEIVKGCSYGSDAGETPELPVGPFDFANSVTLSLGDPRCFDRLSMTWRDGAPAGRCCLTPGGGLH